MEEKKLLFKYRPQLFAEELTEEEKERKRKEEEEKAKKTITIDAKDLEDMKNAMADIKEYKTATDEKMEALANELKEAKEREAKLLEEIGKGSKSDDILAQLKLEEKKKQDKKAKDEKERIRLEKEEEERKEKKQMADKIKKLEVSGMIDRYKVTKPHLKDKLDKIELGEDSNLDDIATELNFIVKHYDNEDVIKAYEDSKKRGVNPFSGYQDKKKEGSSDKAKEKKDRLMEDIKKYRQLGYYDVDEN